jgi:cytoskeleton-associated protein 5
MEGDEAALLAELRAISNQSATSRFQHDATTAEENLPPPSSNIPPTSGVLNGGGGNFKQESTFSGSNGGEANDEELLALLRGVSAKSSSTDRFANETYEGGYDHSRERPAPAPSKPATLAGKNKRDSNEVPPWKRGNAKEVVKKALSPPPKAPPKAAPAPLLGNFKQESTFTGQNGGDANDEELLALLRGVSAKSSSADRFAGEGPATENTKAVVPAPKPASPSKKERTPPPKAAPAPFTGGGNFKQESTFSGTNGGDANDEELLALLRGVSTKSSSVDRFAKDGEEHAISKDDPIVEEALNQSDEAEFFDANDGYDNSFGKPVSSPPKMEAPSAPPSLMRGGNFKQESTFSGERGGDANDEDLLALLRGVSAKSSSADRFGGDGEGQAAPVREDPKPKKAHTAGPEALPLPKSVLSSIAPPLSGTPFDPMSANPFAGDNPDEVLVTTEDLPTALCSKDWKVRKKAYVLLRQLIIKAGGQGNPSGVVDANAIFSGLDDLIPTKCLMDKNANALETAMELSTVYADYCRGGMDAERAEQMIASLIKGSGFTCPRPSAAKVAEALTLKIMEVGDGNASLNAVIRIVLEQGCSSRKPKIVQASCTIVLKAAYAFGAAYLPLAAITQILPSLLTHANKKVRDTTMEIVAELCRTLGSKDPLEDLISKMKKQQEADLDALLQKQPEPTPVQVGLRSSRHSDGKATQSAEDALAALQVGAAEMEAENFAKRPAVNLLVEMGKTEYADKLKVAKWSEKVAALKIILESGGEKPYKLVQPSPSVNYAPLISDMKGVLSHTHFAVVGKAMEVLSMLAQGVGERLYPNIRPLLPKLFQLSKDKKLTKSASACLDAFFGNIVGFAHILDSDSAIPEAADERYQKNVLARTNAIDFLSRCVTRSESAGPRGHLTAPHAKLSALFASLKLKDSDANVRKSAVNALKTLQAVEDPDVKKVVDGVIQELETSNPRVFKSLSGGSGGVKVRYQSGTSKASVPSSAPQREMTTPSPVKSAVKSVPQKRVASVPPPTSKPVSKATVDSGDAPSLDIAIARCSTLNIPLWDVEEDGGGVLSGLQSSKWQLRKIAINGLAEFVSGREVLDSLTNVELDSNCILVLVKENTRGFRETNFNVTKAILEVFLSLCGYHQKSGQSLSEWAVIDAATLATEKIADKKLSALSQVLLTELCVVREPQTVHSACYATMVKIRAPTAHEEFIKWLNRFCNEFGVASIGPRINETVAFLLEVR